MHLGQRFDFDRLPHGTRQRRAGGDHVVMAKKDRLAILQAGFDVVGKFLRAVARVVHDPDIGAAGVAIM